MPTTGGRAADLAKKYLQGMARRSELVPGSVDMIMTRVQGDGAGGDLLSRVARYLEGPGAKFLNPERKAEAAMPTRTIVDRLVAGGVLRKESADRLIREWAAPAAGLGESAVLAMVVRRLESPEHRGDLAEAPPLPYKARRVLGVLDRFRDQLAADVDVEGLAESWSELGDYDGPRLARAVVARLESRAHVLKAGTLEYDRNDPIFSDRPRGDAGGDSPAAGGF